MFEGISTFNRETIGAVSETPPWVFGTDDPAIKIGIRTNEKATAITLAIKVKEEKIIWIIAKTLIPSGVFSGISSIY